MSWWEHRKTQFIPEGLQTSLNNVLGYIDDCQMYSAVKELLEIQKAVEYLEQKLKEDYKTEDRNCLS